MGADIGEDLSEEEEEEQVVAAVMVAVAMGGIGDGKGAVVVWEL